MGETVTPIVEPEPPPVIVEPPPDETVFTIPELTDVEWLERIIAGEARGEPLEGKIAVGNVVLNRVRDRRWPGTIKGVITQRAQFTPVWLSDGKPNPTFFSREISAEVKEAAARVLAGDKAVPDDYFYFSVGQATKYAKDFLKIGNHWFGRDIRDPDLEVENMKPNVKDFIKWLVSHAQSEPDSWGYILGTSGVMCTEALIKARRSYYSSWSTTAYYTAARKWLGKMVADCQGVMDYYYSKIVGIKTEINAHANWSTWCKGYNSRKMADCPLQEGVAVFKIYASGRAHHIGWLCNVNGVWSVVESRGIKYGVVISPFVRSQWHGWGRMMSKFSYDGFWTAPATVKRRSTGAVVRELQVALNLLGAHLTVDGVFGPVTEAAVKAFQKKYGLKIDGIVGPITWAKLHELTENGGVVA
jgi:hypothetical protein